MLQQLGDGQFLARAATHIHHGLKVGVVDLGDHFDGFGRGGEKIGLVFAEWLDAQVDAALLRQGEAVLKNGPGAVPCFPLIPAFLHIALFR